MEKNLFLRSIHDVLTEREPTSDPTETLDQDPALILRKKNPPVPPAAQEGEPPNLALRSIHDVLTPREKNSDPAETNR